MFGIYTTSDSNRNKDDKSTRLTSLPFWSYHIKLPEQSRPGGHPEEPLTSHGKPAPPWGGRGSVWGRLWVPGLQVEAPPVKGQGDYFTAALLLKRPAVCGQQPSLNKQSSSDYRRIKNPQWVARWTAYTSPSCFYFELQPVQVEEFFIIKVCFY